MHKEKIGTIDDHFTLNIDLARDDIIPASEALVQKDYKYVFWPNYDVEELFDLRNDKYELQNLINRTSYKDLLHRMRNRFNKLKVRAL